MTLLNQRRTHPDDQIRGSQIPGTADGAGFTGRACPEFLFFIDGPQIVQNKSLLHEAPDIERRVE